MNTNSKDVSSDIKEVVLGQINADKVKMKPRAYFIAQIVGFFFILILVLVTSSFLLSYILFTLKVSGQLFLLGLGWKGIEAFLFLFPWWFLVFDCFLIIILDSMLKRFTFGYQSPILYLFLGTLTLVVCLGYIINFIPIHKNLMDDVSTKQLPIFHTVYSNLKDLDKKDGVFMGTIININQDTVTVRSDNFYNKDGYIEEIIYLDNISILPELSIGKHVFVAGKRINGFIRAYGLRLLPGVE